MANVRTYNPNVRVGNWNEDIVLEKDTLQDFLYKKDKGELMVQKTDFLRQNILSKIDLTVTTDGWLHFGDVVMLVNPGTERHDCSLEQQQCRDVAAISLHVEPSSVRLGSPVQAPCEVTGTRTLDPCGRTAFVVTSVDGTPEGETVKYNQSFALRTTDGIAGKLYLASDHKTFLKCAKKSRLQEVSLMDQASFLTWWKVVYLDPQERLENEGLPVPVNTTLLIIHCKTNQCLAVLGNYALWTAYGKEYEVTAQTFLDSHKAEKEMNHWMFVTANPDVEGQTIMERPSSTVNMASKGEPEHSAFKDTDEHGIEEKQIL